MTSRFRTAGLSGLTVLTCALLGAALPVAASAEGYTKTMLLKASKCQARIRDLPDSARIDHDANDQGYYGDIIYGHASPVPNWLQFNCISGRFSGVALTRAIGNGTSKRCYLPGDPPKKDRKWFSGPCSAWYYSPVPGTTNVHTYQVQECGAAGGRGGSKSGCGPLLTDYVLVVHGAWIMLDTYQTSSAPVPWIVTMLQHSTFRVARSAGPNNNIFIPNRGWELP